MDSRENRLPPPVLSLPSLAGLLSRLFTLGAKVMLTSRDQLTVVNELIRVGVAIKIGPPYTDSYELTLIKRKLEEDIAFEEVKNVQSGGD